MDRETGVDEKISSRRIFLTLEEWFKIKSRYLHGDVIAAIAREYQMSRKTIESRAKREGWGKKGSRKESFDKKIDEETEGELIDSYKVAVDLANEENLEDIKLIMDTARYALKFVMKLLEDKNAEYEKLKAKGKPLFQPAVDIQILFTVSINNEVRNIGIARRPLQHAIGGSKREILGIKDKPYLVDPTAEKEKSDRSKIFKLGVDKLMRLVDEDKERMRAEIMAEMTEAKGGEQWSYTLQ